jgi:hypothetical protein
MNKKYTIKWSSLKDSLTEIIEEIEIIEEYDTLDNYLIRRQHRLSIATEKEWNWEIIK